MLLFVLAVATVLLAMGLGYQAAKLDRRVKALEAAARTKQGQEVC